VPVLQEQEAVIEMSAGADVVKVVKFDPESIAALRQMTEAAIQEAILRARDRIYTLATGDASQVPVRTGRLRASVDIGFTPRFLALRWSAIDPKSNFDYARIQDEGGTTGTGGYIAPKYYSEVIAQQAKAILREELLIALAGM